MASRKSIIDLGFVEETDSWHLLSHFFPSKVGGKPAWLSLKPLPKPEELTCSICGKPCIFLMEAYAPDDRDTPTCFHRTLFVFVCKDPACCTPNSNGNFVTLRSQLPRDNDFYSNEPPNEEWSDPKYDFPQANQHGDVCVVCGCAGPKRCARCRNSSYCSKEHQTVDWKAGHKKHCKEGSDETVDHAGYLLPEFNLVTEQEVITETEKPEESMEDKMKEYESLVASQETMTLKEVVAVDADLEKMARTESQDDKVFNIFKKRIAHEPQQVLRYDREGVPLWVSSEGILPAEDIPACPCGSPRSFEFQEDLSIQCHTVPLRLLPQLKLQSSFNCTQIMPQLLNHLKLDDVGASIDWGMLAIYTCTANCDIGNNYHKEFIWKQDFSNTDAI